MLLAFVHPVPLYLLPLCLGLGLGLLLGMGLLAAGAGGSLLFTGGDLPFPPFLAPRELGGSIIAL